MEWMLHNLDEVWRLTVEHIELSGTALLLAVVIALPIGFLVAPRRLLDLPVLGVLGVIYTIPSLAFFVILIPYFGPGFVTALIPLVAYAQVVLVRNVVTGLRGVDRDVIEAARGMGMSRQQILVSVELPLAAPVMIAGVRIAAVSTVALAMVAALVNAGGLGELLFVGVSQDHMGKIVAGSVAASALAFAFNAGIGAIEARAHHAASGER
ncbi:MAG: ABC transporter permease [Anaerolineae bacterium]